MAPAPIKKKEHVVLVTSKIGGNYAWYYVLVDTLKKALFEKRVGKEKLNIKDYGTVLYSGWGSHPPEDIQRKLREDFNVENS
ncbi:MAG: hypothetical protein SFT92_07835 [Rickettsiales bacterium]|nr:hypothetical protein [Rickettsiales bacterium]